MEHFNLDQSEPSKTCICERCKKDFVVTGVVLNFFSTFRYCSEKCSEDAYRETKKDDVVAMKNLLPVPPIYRDTDLNKLPEKLRSAAMHWSPKVGNGNLLIHGTSRAGKTRAAWYICKRLHGEGMNVSGYSVRQLEEKLYESSGRNGHHLAFREIAEVPILFIDDLGKEHMSKSGRLAPDLFALLDERTSWRRTTIFTTNHLGDGLRDRFGDAEMGTAFVGRLREFFDIVHP